MLLLKFQKIFSYYLTLHFYSSWTTRWGFPTLETHTDLRNSRVPENPAKVEFCPSRLLNLKEEALDRTLRELV